MFSDNYSSGAGKQVDEIRCGDVPRESSGQTWSLKRRAWSSLGPECGGRGEKWSKDRVLRQPTLGGREDAGSRGGERGGPAAGKQVQDGAAESPSQAGGARASARAPLTGAGTKPGFRLAQGGRQEGLQTDRQLVPGVLP